jgi:hypothetical protein
VADLHQWRDAEQAVLAALDIAAEYKSMGVVFTKDTPTSKGWLPCHALDRKDNTASAAVFVGSGSARGRWRDLGGEGLSCSMWEFAARFGGFRDWKEARKHYAKRAGIQLPGGAEPKRPIDQVELLDTPARDIVLANWAELKGGFDLQTVREVGGRYARYPRKAKAEASQYVVAVPGYQPPGLTDSDPVAWVVANSTGGPVILYNGSGKEPTKSKTLSVGGSVGSLMGEYALRALLAERDGVEGHTAVEIVWKCEGLSDLLTMHHALRVAGLLGRHVVLSNTQGCLESVKPEWVELLRGKVVYVVQDCDRPGQIGATRWCQSLAGKAAEVKNVTLPYEILEAHGADLRDYLFRDKHTIDELLAVAAAAPVSTPGGVDPLSLSADASGATPAAGQRGLFDGTPDSADAPALVELPAYEIHGGRICHCTWTDDGVAHTPLANFWAKVVEEVVHDDGVETATCYAIEGRLQDGRRLPRVLVKASDFADMDWVSAWGVHAIVAVGRGFRDHLRAAIQTLSADAASRRVHAHLGWAQIDGRWHYLHAGGAVGADGPAPGVVVELEGGLANFRLPDPPAGSELAAAVRASLGMLDGLAGDAIAFPLYAAIWRAALGGTDMSVHTPGPSGGFKSELASLAQRHFGLAMHAKNLPANWSSTANALEAQGFLCKDALMVVDDFCPTGSASDRDRLHRDADRFFRAVGNNGGRRRMNADGTLRPEKPPRCLPLSTGEDVPRGESLRARLLIVEIGKGDVKVERLTACQKDAEAGTYAQAMAGFVRWLAPRYDEVKGRLQGDVVGYRDRAAKDGQHRRTPATVGQLAAGFDVFLEFAQDAGALTQAEATSLRERCWSGLTAAAASQASQQASEEPTGQFLRLVSACLASGRAHVAGENGQEPGYAVADGDVPNQVPAAWGWRLDNFGAWVPQGKQIGWLDLDG